MSVGPEGVQRTAHVAADQEAARLDQRRNRRRRRVEAPDDDARRGAHDARSRRRSRPVVATRSPRRAAAAAHRCPPRRTTCGVKPHLALTFSAIVPTMRLPALSCVTPGVVEHLRPRRPARRADEGADAVTQRDARTRAAPEALLPPDEKLARLHVRGREAPDSPAAGREPAPRRDRCPGRAPRSRAGRRRRPRRGRA